MKIIYSYLRGHPIKYYEKIKKWLYAGSCQIANDSRPCPRCGKLPTKDGYDACLGKIEGAVSACCGHGVHKPILVKGNKNGLPKNTTTNHNS